MKNRKIILVGATLALVTVVFSVWLGSLRPPQPKITISFANYTTNSAGLRVAALKLLNTGDATLLFNQTCGAMAEGTAPRITPFTPVDLTGISLRPGESTNLLVAPPVANGPWRFGVGYCAKAEASSSWTRTSLALRLGRFVPDFLMKHDFYTWSEKL